MVARKALFWNHNMGNIMSAVEGEMLKVGECRRIPQKMAMYCWIALGDIFRSSDIW